MRLTVNGEARVIEHGSTVGMLVSTLAPRHDGTTRGVAVAVEGVVVPRSQWDCTELAPEAVVEVLTAVQGG